MLGLADRRRSAHGRCDRPVVFLGPYEHHSNELPWRESAAEVVAIDADARGRIDVARPGPPAATATPDAPAHRQLLGRVQCHRIDLRHRPGRRAAARARRAGVLGLRRRRAVPADPDGERAGRARATTRTRCSSRRTSSSAVRRRPACSSWTAGSCRDRADGARRRHDRVRQPDPPRLRGRPGGPGGGRHAGDRGVDPRRPGLRAQGGGRHRRHPRPRTSASRSGCSPSAGGASRTSNSSAIPTRPGCPSSRSGSGTATRLLHHAYVVALLNDLFGIQARGGCSCAGPYGHRLLCDRRARVRRDRGRGGPRPPRDQAGLDPDQPPVLPGRRGRRLHRRGGRTRRPRTATGCSPTTCSFPDTGLWRHRAAATGSHRSTSRTSPGTPWAPRSTAAGRADGDALADHLERARGAPRRPARPGAGRTHRPARRVRGAAPLPPAAGVCRAMTVLLDLDVPARPAADRPVGRRWVLGGLLGAAGALALARGHPRRAVDPTRAPSGRRAGWGSFAGPVPGSELYLLVAVDAAGSAIAHACDGHGHRGVVPRPGPRRYPHGSLRRPGRAPRRSAWIRRYWTPPRRAGSPRTGSRGRRDRRRRGPAPSRSARPRPTAVSSPPVPPPHDADVRGELGPARARPAAWRAHRHLRECRRGTGDRSGSVRPRRWCPPARPSATACASIPYGWTGSPGSGPAWPRSSGRPHHPDPPGRRSAGLEAFDHAAQVVAFDGGRHQLGERVRACRRTPARPAPASAAAFSWS